MTKTAIDYMRDAIKDYNRRCELPMMPTIEIISMAEYRHRCAELAKTKEGKAFGDAFWKWKTP